MIFTNTLSYSYDSLKTNKVSIPNFRIFQYIIHADKPNNRPSPSVTLSVKIDSCSLCLWQTYDSKLLMKLLIFPSLLLYSVGITIVLHLISFRTSIVFLSFGQVVYVLYSEGTFKPIGNGSMPLSDTSIPYNFHS